MKVVFIDTVHPILEERLTKAGYTCFDATKLTRLECENIVSDAIGIVIRSRFKMDKEFLSNAKELKFIARSGAGMENIDIQYSENNNIKLYNAPEGNRNAVAEHALGMLLSLFNKLHSANQEVRSGIWDREGNRGIELDGKTVGLIGFGNNGAAFANKLQGFNVNVLAYDKYKTGFGNEFVKESSLELIYQNCDVVSFHIPQNEETIYFANDEFFSSFDKNIYLINLSRGKIVQTSSLVKHLKNGKVLGACLDVLEFEKTSFESFFDERKELNSDFKYLLQSNEVLFSPHVGGWTTESYFKLSDVLANKILGE